MSFRPEPPSLFPIAPARPCYTPKPCALHEDHLFRAGQVAPPGVYQQVDGLRRTVVLHGPDYLPASLDGRVACYQRVSADNLADKRF